MAYRPSPACETCVCVFVYVCVAAGVGITRDGLATLFREYVQGTEDEMCKPRTRGGTGLGLSICSKQVRGDQQAQRDRGQDRQQVACDYCSADCQL